MEPIQILFADNQFLIREGVIASLKKAGNYKIKTVDSKDEFSSQLKENHFDLVIMDNTFFGIANAYRFTEVKRFKPDLKFLLLTNGMTHSEIADFSNVGIYNIIVKTSNQDVFNKAIEHTMKNKIYYSDELLELLLQHNNRKNAVTKNNTLTPSELDIVKLIVQGLSTRHISEIKQVSYHTVVSHKKNIFRKLNVNTCSELIVFAIKQGLIESIDYAI